MPEIPGLPEIPKQPIFSNEYLRAAVYIISLGMFLFVGYSYFVSNKKCDETSSVGLEIMAKKFVESEAKGALQQLHLNKLQQDSIYNAAQQWKSNNYLKKKVLNPLKKQYNDR